MKKIVLSSLLLIMSLFLMTSCVITPGYVGFTSPVVVGPPTVEVGVGVAVVPETYVWDGFEYVGVVGGGYVYLGPGGVWLACEPWRLERFHGWERGHPDWRGHPEHFGGGQHSIGPTRK